MYIEASCGAGAQVCDCKRDILWVWFPDDEMKYSIMSFLYSGVEAKYCVKLHHSIHNVLRILQKMGLS